MGMMWSVRFVFEKRILQLYKNKTLFKFGSFALLNKSVEINNSAFLISFYQLSKTSNNNYYLVSYYDSSMSVTSVVLLISNT